MTLRAVILDLDGTLLERDGSPAAGVPDMLTCLEAAGLRIAIASNQPGAGQKLANAGIRADLVLDFASVGSNKGTKDWVEKAFADFDVAPQELIWLGDGDLDMRSAVNSKVAYFNAGWSAPTYPYGINLPTPSLFATVASECFTKPIDWFIQERGADLAGRPAIVYAMTDSRGGGDRELEAQLRHFLKERADFALGPLQFGDVVTLHLLGSIYGTGLSQATDTWTIYPGSKRDSGTNASLAPFVANAARLFRTSYVDDLLIRHTDAPDSGQTRAQGGRVGFGNQVNTVHLNPARQQKITGKRVVVVDDFETNGNSLECARNLLLQANAAQVTCVAIGKYRMRKYGLARAVWAPVDDYRWDPYAPTAHIRENFRGKIIPLDGDETAPVYFRDSCHRIAKM